MVAVESFEIIRENVVARIVGHNVVCYQYVGLNTELNSDVS